MKRRIRLAAGVAAAGMLWAGLAVAQGTPPGCDTARTPERVEGLVVKIAVEEGKVMVRGTDGTTHEFRASKDMIQTYKENRS